MMVDSSATTARPWSRASCTSGATTNQLSSYVPAVRWDRQALLVLAAVMWPVTAAMRLQGLGEAIVGVL